MKRAVQTGWKGRFYEDFIVGEVYAHTLDRTITQTDNSWFTQLTQNTNPIHFDVHYAEQTEYGRPLVTGQSVSDISQNAMANLGWDEVRIPNPVFEGDTIYSYSELLNKRESRTRPTLGIIEVKTVGYNQHGTIVITFKRTMMVYKRGHAPVGSMKLLNQVLTHKGECEG